jgi:Domain of unknown function (DUF4832)
MRKHKIRSKTAIKLLCVLLVISLVLFLIIILKQRTPPSSSKIVTPSPSVTLSPSATPTTTAKPTPSNSDPVTFSPSVIPATTEIGNPERGPEYYGDEAPPPNFPLVQYSHRWCWSEIEASQGQYNFRLIDDLAATAKAHGGTFGWRIMPENDFATQPCLPAYLSKVVGGGTNVDFDNPYYLQRVQAMLDALSQRYANDPRIDLLDMSYEGCYGEWHNACGGTDMSAPNRQKLIDMQYTAFPTKRFFMLTSQKDSLAYALQATRTKPTGVRFDCLGDSDIGGARDALNNDTLEHSRWKVAPLYFEYCSNPDFALSLQDIKRYHASLIGDGDGNINAFGSYNTATQKLILESYKAAGYRFELNSLTLPKQLAAGQQFQVTSQWKNVNSAPAYAPWNVMIQLRNTSNQVVWQEKSTLDLRIPFSDTSQGNDTKTVTDRFTLPATIANGQYTVAVQIVHADNYYSPLALAIQGRQPDGSYSLGNTTVIGLSQPTR